MERANDREVLHAVIMEGFSRAMSDTDLNRSEERIATYVLAYCQLVGNAELIRALNRIADGLEKK